MNNTLGSLSGGVGHRQTLSLPIVVAEDIDVISEVDEEPISSWEENGRDHLHPFEVVNGFIFQWRIHHHLQSAWESASDAAVLLPWMN